jgi:exonuclease SbcC
MIPVRLQLKNFMSYGEGVPPLELGGIRLACLSGDNGNGKTALLDAITWALFGKTRAKSEDDVIRLGASDVRVLFDFDVDGVKYRVHKGRSKRGGSIWELQVWQEDGTPRSLTGTNARETQEKIRGVLRMDYETFLSTGYLAQGRADVFATATANQRKEVLGSILDLSRYDRLEQMAKEKRGEAEARELDAEREINAMDRELENEDRFHLALEAAQRRLAEASEMVEARQADYQKLHTVIERLSEQEDKAKDYEERIREVQDEIAVNRRAAAEAEARVAQADLVVARRVEIEEAHANFTRLTARVAPLEKQYDSVLALQREAQGLERQIQAEYEKLDRERYRLDCDIKTLEEEGRERTRYENEVRRLDDEIASYGNPEARRQEAEKARQEAEAALLELRTQHAGLKAQVEVLDKRLNALLSSDAAECEFCGQPLPPAKRKAAQNEAEDGKAALSADMGTLATAGRDKKREADSWKAEEDNARRDLTALSSLDARKGQATQELFRITERTKMLPDVHRRFSALDTQINERAYAQAEQDRLVQVSALLEKGERVAQELTSVRAELERLRDAERNLLHLQNALQVLETEPARAADLRAQIEKREGQIEKAHAKIGEIRAKTAALPSLHREQEEANARLREANDVARQAEREIGEFTSRLNHCETLKSERARRVEERLAAAKEKDLYKELVGAFGKKGVQALIIENALPEIEEQANQLLGRMTDGGMQVQLVTQKERKSKGEGAIETLDIIISDDMGTRPYEMYSGGEAFRVNFALRVALSKMLARRAGAPLQTLILDEGFGTQDPRGREAIADALHAIMDDFALILVITHIEELKEAFPTRIEVTKGSSGSTFTVG